MHWTNFVAEVLPILLGLLLAAYLAWNMYVRRAQFFEVARGLMLSLAVAAMIALWSTQLAAAFLSGSLEDVSRIVGIVFVVFTAWLSVSLVSLAALYPNLSSAGDLRAWLRKKRSNLITLWGVAGLAVLVGTTLGSAIQMRPISESEWTLLPVGTYLVVSIALALAIPISATRKGKLRNLSPKGMIGMALLGTAWLGLPTAEFALNVVPEVMVDFRGHNPYPWLMLMFFIVIAESTRTTGFLGLVVAPEAEGLKRDGFRSFDIPRGVYLICDSKPDSAFHLFSELSTLPLRPDAMIPAGEESAKATLEFLIPNGLVVTREFPDQARQRYGLQTTPMIWLTESPGERRIAPTSLTVFADTITRFMEANPNSIVLLEGAEYLCIHNDFRKVLKQLDSLNEVTWISRARLLIAVDPGAFDQKDLALLERDRTVIIGAEGIEELKRESRVSASFEQ